MVAIYLMYSRKSQESISSVALLSPACFLDFVAHGLPVPGLGRAGKGWTPRTLLGLFLPTQCKRKNWWEEVSYGGYIDIQHFYRVAKTHWHRRPRVVKYGGGDGGTLPHHPGVVPPP